MHNTHQGSEDEVLTSAETHPSGPWAPVRGAWTARVLWVLPTSKSAFSWVRSMNGHISPAHHRGSFKTTQGRGIPQSYLRGCVLGLHPKCCPPNKTNFKKKKKHSKKHIPENRIVLQGYLRFTKITATRPMLPFTSRLSWLGQPVGS